MKVKHTSMEGLVELIPTIFSDERGLFFESYNEKLFATLGLPMHFVQDNQSFSIKGVVRGLHFQRAPFEQGKLVRVITGKALDIAVDLRPQSATFGQWQSFLLDAQLGNMVYVPEGFAHGFSALEDTIFSYKCTNIYDKSSEGGLLWNDPRLNIDWQVANPIVSSKDQILSTFAQLFEK